MKVVARPQPLLSVWTPLFRKSRTAVSLFCLCAALSLSAGCFGRFPLTTEIYRINQETTGNEFYQTVIFWSLVIVPVYPGAMIVDTIAINPFEFWAPEPDYYARQQERPQRRSFWGTESYEPPTPVKRRSAWFTQPAPGSYGYSDEENIPAPPPERPRNSFVREKP